MGSKERAWIKYDDSRGHIDKDDTNIHMMGYAQERKLETL